jgi:NADPH2:quinone reductase
MKAVRVHTVGGPEVLHYEDVATPEPGPGQALVKVEAIGLNFIDCYHRSGLYALPLPFVPGSEAAGRVAALGPGASGVAVGERVAYAPSLGAYAEYAVVAADRLLPVPAAMETATAAAIALQGMTAHYLATSTCPLDRGDWALVHAAAGGVGLLLVQIAKMRGARVIGTVSTAEKAALARQAGADEVVRYTEEDFRAAVDRLTGGRGVRVAYDSVGRTTFDKSLECVGSRGVLALFGQSSGPVPPVDPARLAKQAVFLTRPSLGHYTATRDELLRRSADVFDWVVSGRLTVRIHQTLPLKDAAQAHRLLEGRKTSGKVLLVP